MLENWLLANLKFTARNQNETSIQINERPHRRFVIHPGCEWFYLILTHHLIHGSLDPRESSHKMASQYFDHPFLYSSPVWNCRLITHWSGEWICPTLSPNLIHSFLGTKESAFQTASRSIRHFNTAHARDFHAFSLGRTTPKIAPSPWGYGPHLVMVLWTHRSYPQTASRSFQL